jgi:Uma2 family endonuclease
MDLGNDRQTHLTYHRGQLELLTPLEVHDRVHRLLESFLLLMADEAGQSLDSLGAVLLLQPDLALAIQPAGCYYLNQRLRPRERAELDLRQTPPPLLVVDIQMGPSPERLSLLASLGIREIWQYVTSVQPDDLLQGQLSLYRTTGEGQYEAISQSSVFPWVTPQRVMEFLQQSDSIGLVQALTVLRRWAAAAIVAQPDR